MRRTIALGALAALLAGCPDESTTARTPEPAPAPSEPGPTGTRSPAAAGTAEERRPRQPRTRAPRRGQEDRGALSALPALAQGALRNRALAEARREYSGGNHRRVLALCREVLHNEPDNAAAKQLLVVAACQLGDVETVQELRPGLDDAARAATDRICRAAGVDLR